MNIETVEYGLLVKNVSYNEIYKLAHSDEDNECAHVYSMVVETHPWNTDKIHISFGELADSLGSFVELVNSKQILPKEPARSKQIRRWFKRHLPKAKLTWGMILTER